MKRLLMIIMLALTMSNASALSVDTVVHNAKANVDTVISIVDTSSTFKQFYSDLKSGILAIASALKINSEHVYGILVRQQVVSTITWLVTLFIGIVLVFIFVKAAKNKDEEWEINGDPTLLGVMRVIMGVIGLIAIIAGLINTSTIISGLINPEYGAIQDIMHFIK